MLLPYVDQGALYNKINFANAFDGKCHLATHELARLAALGENPEVSSVPVAYCPSDPRSGEIVDRGALESFRPANYAGVCGTYCYNAPDPFVQWRCPNDPNFGTPSPINGMLGLASAVRFDNVPDGLSQTLLLGERGITITGRPTLIVGGRGISWTGELRSGEAGNDIHLYHFWSYHPGGAHFALGDGSVRLISYQIPDWVIAALSTRAGSEIVSEF